MLDGLIIIVPLLAGLALIGVIVLGMFRNPSVSNSNATMLGVAALLCVAPTILNLTAKLPGGTEITLVKDQLKDQAQQIKNDVGTQGADIRGQIVALSKRIDVLEKGTAAAPAPAEKQQYDSNRSKTVVVLYADGRKELAIQMQDYLLQRGYNASAVYTDFTELSDASRQQAGTIAIVSAETSSPLRTEVEGTLRTKFPQQLQKVVDAMAPKIAGNAVQVRLF